MTRVVSAFPGTGKTFFAEHAEADVLDSDSSTYSWTEDGTRHPDFPENYVTHIKDAMQNYDIVLVSSHQEVREALVQEEIDYTLAYPEPGLKDEYMERFRERGDPTQFIEKLAENWETWLTQCMEQEGCTHIQLGSGAFLSDVL